MACQRTPDSHGTFLIKVARILRSNFRTGPQSRPTQRIHCRHAEKCPRHSYRWAIFHFLILGFGRSAASLDELLLREGFFSKRSLSIQLGLSLSGGGSCTPFGVEMRCLSSTENSR